MKLGEKLRTLREQKNWTQPQAAEAIGIEQSYLSKLENDHSAPSADVFRRIITAYETDIASFVDDLEPGTLVQLTQVPDVTDYLQVKKKLRYEINQRRLQRLILAVALGAGFIYAGLTGLFFPNSANDDEWMNQSITFLGIVSLVYGLVGLLALESSRKGS